MRSTSRIDATATSSRRFSSIVERDTSKVLYSRIGSSATWTRLTPAPSCPRAGRGTPNLTRSARQNPMSAVIRSSSNTGAARRMRSACSDLSSSQRAATSPPLTSDSVATWSAWISAKSSSFAAPPSQEPRRPRSAFGRRSDAPPDETGRAAQRDCGSEGDQHDLEQAGRDDRLSGRAARSARSPPSRWEPTACSLTRATWRYGPGRPRLRAHGRARRAERRRLPLPRRVLVRPPSPGSRPSRVGTVRPVSSDESDRHRLCDPVGLARAAAPPCRRARPSRNRRRASRCTLSWTPWARTAASSSGWRSRCS